MHNVSVNGCLPHICVSASGGSLAIHNAYIIPVSRKGAHPIWAQQLYLQHTVWPCTHVYCWKKMLESAFARCHKKQGSFLLIVHNEILNST